MSKCKIESCSNEINIKQVELCWKHYKQQYRANKLEIRRPVVDKSKLCIAEGCERSQQTKEGYCLMHYKRFKRTGNVILTKNFQKDKECLYCDKKIGLQGAKGMCSRHYQIHKLHGNPLHVENKRSLPGSSGYFRDRDGISIHRKLYEEFLGRKLTAKEVIHHIDGNKTNNKINNLYLCKDKSYHTSLHQQINNYKRKGIKLSCLKFENGKYVYK